MTDTFRWGILSTGWIATQFVEGLSAVPDAVAVAVGSRSQVSADAFGDRYGIPNRHATYEDLANDPDVDGIYIGTPHPMHRENALVCLAAGKPVLCEKPFTLNAPHTKDVIEFARQKNLFLMEAMWTRYIPAVIKIRELIADGTIGDVHQVYADFGYRTDYNPEHRAFNPDLGGGALLDVGIYPISFASMVFGEQPAEIHSFARLGGTRTDDENTMVFRYAGGQMAMLSSAVGLRTPSEASIIGTKGYIRVHYPFWKPHKITVMVEGKGEETFEMPLRKNGYEYEAEEAARCIRAGKLESDVMPLAESLALMETLDRIRAQWGLVYPGE